jgi:uncharacterized protein with PIN domain
MVIDTSALVTILSADTRRMSIATFVEISVVVEARHGAEGLRNACKGEDFVHSDVMIAEVENSG